MSAKFPTFLLAALTLLSLMFADPAAAANGTLSYTFKYKDPSTGVETFLSPGWAYLRSAANPPPMEKFFSRPDHILTGAYTNGFHRFDVPEGTYYLRITKRKFRSGDESWLGPPEEGDYTWMQTMPITIVANQTLNLGTIYATPFGAAPITITGTVMGTNGLPMVGQYVRAQTEPCIDGSVEYPNQCGPTKILAQQRTDAQGRYTLELRDPGTYYIYATGTLAQGSPEGEWGYAGTGAPGPVAVEPVTVTKGDTVTVNITKIWFAPD